MGSFSLATMKSSDEDSMIYPINLNSIPLKLTDEVLCVLSLSAPTFNITRRYLSIMNNNIGNFTLSIQGLSSTGANVRGYSAVSANGKVFWIAVSA